jgi:hypothetical protein
MESEKLKDSNTQPEQEETTIQCLIIKDMSDAYIRYEVNTINLGRCIKPC